MNTGIVAVSILLVLLSGSITAFPTIILKPLDLLSFRPHKMAKAQATANSCQSADHHHHRMHSTWLESMKNSAFGIPPLKLVPETKLALFRNAI
ncbi:unnamed protein product [Orchesella dallaii]|uniref:Secreted protein n=1 Tax=Orchesella dallaii TaxID=48710 RepID=A0ABP1QMS1_9HEXA